MNGTFPALEAKHCPNSVSQTDKAPEAIGSFQLSTSVTNLSSSNTGKRPCASAARRDQQDFPWLPRRAGSAIRMSPPGHHGTDDRGNPAHARLH
jgi:hypothetical protein